MKKIILFLFVSAAIFTACKKDKAPKATTETPTKTIVEKRVMVDTAKILNNGSFEVGLKFYSSRNGTITKLGCRMASKGNFRVSLWDFDSKNLIAATTVNVQDSLNFFYNSVSPIAITANTRYVVSLNNTDAGVNKGYYVYGKKPNFGSILYPFTTGSITFERVMERTSSTSVFPGTMNAEETLFIGPDFQIEYSE